MFCLSFRSAFSPEEHEKTSTPASSSSPILFVPETEGSVAQNVQKQTLMRIDTYKECLAFGILNVDGRLAITEIHEHVRE